MTWWGEWIPEAARHDPEWPDHSISRLRAAIAARTEAIRTGGSPDLALFGRIALGRNRSERWTEALSSALLGDWVAPLYDGTGLGRPELDRLRSEARRIHTQSVPLWQRRPGRNRVIPPGDARPQRRDAARPAPQPVPPRQPGAQSDPRRRPPLGSHPGRTEPGRQGCRSRSRPQRRATWADAAALTGSERPHKDGYRVRRTVRLELLPAGGGVAFTSQSRKASGPSARACICRAEPAESAKGCASASWSVTGHAA